jgi:replicative DNA helicase
MRALELAESALIGVLLIHPQGIAEIPWLDASDFSEDGRGAVFAEIRRQVRSGGAVDAMSIANGVRSRADVHPLLLSVSRLHSMMALAPRTAGHDVVLYGRMVLEAAIRRHVRGLGVEVSAAPLGEPTLAPRRVIDMTSHALDSVDALRDRWNGSIERPDDRNRARLAAARQLGQIEPPSREAVAAAERHLIAAAITGPAARELVDRFGPDDFAERATSATWRAVATLNDSDRPVNVVTVAWEQQRGVTQFGQGLTVDELRKLAGVPPVGVDTDADIVAAARLCRVTAAATRNLATAVNRAGLAVDDVLTTARLSVDAMCGVAERVAPRVPDPTVSANLAARAESDTLRDTRRPVPVPGPRHVVP